jgi:hypothetical protein
LVSSPWFYQYRVRLLQLRVKHWTGESGRVERPQHLLEVGRDELHNISRKGTQWQVLNFLHRKPT